MFKPSDKTHSAKLRALLSVLAVLLVLLRLPLVDSDSPIKTAVWGVLALTATGCALWPVRESSANIKFGWFTIALLLWCGATILLGHPHEAFRPWFRYALFIGAMLLLSPALSTAQLCRLRTAIWVFLLSALVVIEAVTPFHLIYASICRGSLWCFGYRGLLNMSMFFSMISSIVAVIITFYLLSRPLNRIASATVSCALLICLAFVMMGGSRIATLAYIAAFAALTLQIRNRRTMLIAGSLAGVMALLIIIPATRHILLSTLEFKFRHALENSSIIYTRKVFFEARWAEIVQSPIWGVGFSGARELALPWSNAELLFNQGKLEPGTSWLGLPAQTGIVGLLLFIAINVRAFRSLMAKDRPCTGIPGTEITGNKAINRFYNRLETFFTDRRLLLALYTAMITIGITEGYVLAGGSPFFMIFWLLISMMYGAPELKIICSAK